MCLCTLVFPYLIHMVSFFTHVFSEQLFFTGSSDDSLYPFRVLEALISFRRFSDSPDSMLNIIV